MGRKLHADERGISPVLGGMLALGIIVTVSSVLLAVWIPSEVNRRGEEYMRGVEWSFRELGVTIGDLRIGENGGVNLKMGPEPLPLVPNPRTGGTLSVTPAELEIRGESRRLVRIPGENVIHTLWFEILPGELEAYDWYIMVRTTENKEERIESVFFCVNHENFDDWDYHYTPMSQGLENAFPDEHGGMDNELHEGWNYISVLVVSGGAGAWVEVHVAMFPACTPPQDVTLENKSDLGSFRFDWGNRSLVYESGMIILVQDNMSLMRSPPGAVTVMQVDENNFEVHLNTIRVRRFEGSISGTGTSTVTVSVSQEYWRGKPGENREKVTIWINSSYGDAWLEYLANEVNELRAMGINAELIEEGNFLTLIIEGDGKNIHFYQKVTNIEVNLE